MGNNARMLPDNIFGMMMEGKRKIRVSADLTDGASVEGLLIDAVRWQDVGLDSLGVLKHKGHENYFPVTWITELRVEKNGEYEAVYSAQA